MDCLTLQGAESSGLQNLLREMRDMIQGMNSAWQLLFQQDVFKPFLYISNFDFLLYLSTVMISPFFYVLIIHSFILICCIFWMLLIVLFVLKSWIFP